MTLAELEPPDAATLADRLAGLPPIDHAVRVERLRERLDGAGCDGLLVTHLTNIRWLTGFTGSAGLVVLTPDTLVVVTDGRYTDQAADQLGAAGLGRDEGVTLEITSTDQRRIVEDAVVGRRRIGLEADHVTWTAQQRYADEWLVDHEVVATTDLVESVRLVKDDAELARMAAAASVADLALASVRRRLLDGPTEAEFGLELDTAMRRFGATRPSFETIVASGPNGARPHARPSTRANAGGALGVIDVGAVAPGVPAAEVDAACREVIEDAGWGEAFSHGTGHGVGLDIHEAPRVGSTSSADLAVGQVVTVEPGVYLPDHGGVRIEDSLVVTTDGYRPLTLTSKRTAP